MTDKGIWVQLRSFPACSVFVRYDEIERAQDSRGRYTNQEHVIARNIAIGKRCGSYPRQHGDIVAKECAS